VAALGTSRKRVSALRCPKCLNLLLYDGKGFSCLACTHVVREPDSSKLIMLPLKDSKNGKKKD
jgi:hypothetical protein